MPEGVGQGTAINPYEPIGGCEEVKISGPLQRSNNGSHRSPQTPGKLYDNQPIGNGLYPWNYVH